MADAEGVIGELKTQHGLDRARCRGTPLFHVQLLVGCAALNLKRLATHAGEAAEGRAAQPAEGQAVTLRAVGAAARPDEGAESAPIELGGEISGLGTVSAALLWSFSVSLN